MVDQKSLDNMPPHTSIRGEIVISKKNFKKIQKYDSKLKNPRSAMAGLVNTDKIDTRIAKKATIVMYNILSPSYTISKQLIKLNKWGFNTVWNKKLILEDIDIKCSLKKKGTMYINCNTSLLKESSVKSDSKCVEYNKLLKIIETKLKELLILRKETSEYLVDGIVLADDSKTYIHQSKNPTHAMAFKMNVSSNMKNVEVKEVIWEPTMYSYLQPVIKIEPTVMEGNVTVTYITAHNAKYVWNNNIGKQTILKIVRSGDVIPYIVDVVKPSVRPDMPTYKYMWNDSKVDIIAVDPSEEVLRKIIIKRNLHFFRTLGVKYLSAGIIMKLYDDNYKTILSLIIASNKKDIKPYNINGLGKRMVMKIYKQIDNVFANIKLPELMAGSLIFGRGMGVKKIREIIKVYPDILEHRNEEKDYLRDMILEIEGFSEKSASRFIDNLNNFYRFLEDIRNNTNYELLFTTDNKETNKDVLFVNKKVVLTGFRSKEITDFIESNGGKITSTVSKNTNLVIYVPGDKTGSKFNKAQQLGIKLLTKIDFEKKYFK
jgi:NAD-dependent DNA ligase